MYEFKPELIKSVTNGWNGMAKQEIKLTTANYGGTVYYQVSESDYFNYDVRTYKTLKGAEKRFEKLDRLMVKK